jgi:hypothetical protein
MKTSRAHNAYSTPPPLSELVPPRFPPLTVPLEGPGTEDYKFPEEKQGGLVLRQPQNPGKDAMPDAAPAPSPADEKPTRKDRHRPGYVAPDRRGGKQIGITLKKEVVAAFGEAAKIKGTTMKALLEEFILETIRTTLPKDKQKSLKKVNEALAERAIARIRAHYGVDASPTP